MPSLPLEEGRSALKTVQWTVFSEAGPAGPRQRCPKAALSKTKLVRRKAELPVSDSKNQTRHRRGG